MTTSIVCPRCLTHFDRDYFCVCPKDGQPLVPKYHNLGFDRQSLVPFANRFAKILPFHSEACREPESLRSPLIDAKEFGNKYGIPQLFLKNECCLPTGTTKARMAAVSLAFLFDRHVKHFVVISTGNSTLAMARLMKLYPELFMTAFVSEQFTERNKFAQYKNINVQVVPGDFVSAENKAKLYAKKNNLVWEGGFFNPARRIGLSTSYLESCDEIGESPHWYFQAVSSGMGVVGVSEMSMAQMTITNSRRPRLVAVQQESCAPMVHAHREGCASILSRHKIINPSGIAKAILRGDPTSSYPILRSHILRSGGDILGVNENEIFHAKHLCKEHFNLEIGESAAAALAGAIKKGQLGVFEKNEIILVNLTGKQ